MTQSPFEFCPSCVEEERSIFHEQGVQDLTANLLLRGKEMIKGNLQRI